MTRVFFAPGRNETSPVARLRAHGFARELVRRGHDARVLPNHVPVLAPRHRLVLPVLRTVIELRLALHALRPGDVLYLVRMQGIPGVVRNLIAQARRRGAALVYDFDDAVYLRNPRRTAYLCRNADHVVVASHGLVPYVESHGVPRSIIPTPIDPDEYPVRTPHQPAVVGWSGTPSNLPFLKEIWPAVASACRRTGARPQVLTRLASGVPDLPGAEFIEWRLDDYRHRIAGFQVGLSPLPDNSWTRGKLGYKAIEYQACGVPALAAPVQAKDGVVLDGRTGFHPSSLEEWEERIVQLVTDGELRDRLAREARQHAVRTFSFSSVGGALDSAVQKAKASLE